MAISWETFIGHISIKDSWKQILFYGLWSRVLRVIQALEQDKLWRNLFKKILSTVWNYLNIVSSCLRFQLNFFDFRFWVESFWSSAARGLKFQKITCDIFMKGWSFKVFSSGSSVTFFLATSSFCLRSTCPNTINQAKSMCRTFGQFMIFCDGIFWADFDSCFVLD